MSAKSLPATVVALGWVSFFNDLASEMVTPLLPILVAGVLGAGPVALGLIEGTAEAVASLLKLWAGRWSDRLGGRRKPLVLGGYLLSNLVRPLFGLVGSWPQLLLLRALDRVGKGVRGAPRDALLVDVTPLPLRGRAFGLLRGLDNGGAMGGALMAAGLLAAGVVGVPQLVMLSAIPGALVLLLVVLFVRDRRAVPGAAASLPPSRGPWSDLPPALRRVLVLAGLFMFARVSETFVVLRGQELGGSPAVLLLLWAAMSLAKSVSAWRGGHLSDRLGHGRVTLLGWGALALGLGLLALPGSLPALWAATLAYGALAGLSEGAERALVGEFAAAGTRGTAFGWYNMLSGLLAIPAGALFGTVWTVFGAGVAFAWAAAVAGLLALALRVAVVRRRGTGT